MKIKLCLIIILLSSILVGCKAKEEVKKGSYDFIIYESDKNNSDLSDNEIVVNYHIEYENAKVITDTLIKKGNKYYFSEESADYLILENGPYGLNYTFGYFENYAECKNGEIDISWSMTTVNGKSAVSGIGETSLVDLEEYGFIINGWKV